MSDIIVLKFGSSVLRSAADLPAAVDEIYSNWRMGRRVVAVVSAFDGVTDGLAAKAEALGGPTEAHAYATLLGSGECESASLLALDLARHGIPARLLLPAEIGLTAHGAPLDAEPHGLDDGALAGALDAVPVVVVPGFVAVDEHGRTVLLGRGGSDCTALFLAGRLGADCILLKDVDGLYERDPALPGPRPRRFVRASWDDAQRVGGKLVQPKTVRHAHLLRQPFTVRALASGGGTRVDAGPAELAPDAARAPISVVLLGLGNVGRGVWERLRAQPDRFAVRCIVVRDTTRAREDVPAGLLSTNPWDAVNVAADLVIEALGGESPAADVIQAALLAGRRVVSANKLALVARWPELRPFADGPAPRLVLGAAAGGALPVLESLARVARQDGVVAVRGVLNGTCNYVLDRMAAGSGYREALGEAQARGLAEADPTADVSGLDAACKLRLAAWAAFGVEPVTVKASGIEGLAAAGRRADGRVLRLVATLEADAGRVTARVSPQWCGPEDFLAGARGEENRIEILTRRGQRLRLAGSGAGRWPTTAAVLGDLNALWREHAATSAAREPGQRATACATPRPASRSPRGAAA